MSYETIDEGAGLVFRFHGDVAIKEIMTANTEGWEHPNWETHRYQIWDYSNVKTMIVEEQESVVVAKMDSVAFQATLPMKIALLATSEHIIEILETYVASLRGENMEAQIFADEATARQWLDG